MNVYEIPVNGKICLQVFYVVREMMKCRILNNKNGLSKTVLTAVLISSFLFSACGMEGMPWTEPEIIDETPPHIWEETVSEEIIQGELNTDVTEPDAAREDENKSWNKLENVVMAENKAVLANTGTVVEREKYCVFSFMKAVPDKECFFVCSSEEIHLVYYDQDKKYIGGRASAAIEGEFLELPSDCEYITVSMELGAVEDSFLIQESEEENNVIFVGDGRRYSSVKKAVEHIADEGIVVIFPGIYKGNVKAWGKNIVLYGTDKDTCIIENSSSSYYAPPLEIAAGAVKNLTIRAVGTPSADTSKAGAYAVHVEDNILYNHTLSFENCELYSDFNSAVGMGMRGGCDVRFTGVHMTGLENGLFCHDGVYAKYAGVQNLSIIDCVIEGLKGENAVRFDSQGTPGSQVNLLFVNNILVNSRAKNVDNLLHTQNNGGKGTEENWQKLKQFYLDERSTRNNVDALNY